MAAVLVSLAKVSVATRLDSEPVVMAEVIAAVKLLPPVGMSMRAVLSSLPSVPRVDLRSLWVVGPAGVGAGVGDEVYGLPITKVLGVVEANRSALSYTGQETVLPFGSGVVPVRELSALLDVVVPPRDDKTATPFVVVETEPGRLALAVDKLLGQEEVVLKALSRPLDLVPGLSGVTVLGSGRPVFILDVTRLELPKASGGEA